MFFQRDFLDVRALEDHEHNVERWYGSQAGVGRVASTSTLTAFRLTSGNNAYGNWTQLADVNDTPINLGMLAYDPHRIFVVAASQNTVYRLQFAFGLSTPANALAAGQYSSLVYQADAGAAARRPFDVRVPRLPVHGLFWARCWNATNLATLDLFYGLHEYNFSSELVLV